MNNTDDSKYITMTTAPVSKLVLTLSIPTILSMLITNIYNLADTHFVGTLGNSASGAVGIVFGFMAILQAIGFLFGQGSGSILSRKLGQLDYEGASQTASTAFVTSFILSLIAEVICLSNLHGLVMLLGSTDTIAPYAETYIFYILLAAPFVTTSFTLNNILRYEGRAALGMIGMMAGALLNIVGDYYLIIVRDMGITGAGISTAVSQLISFCILLSMFVFNKTQCKLSLKNCLFTFRNLSNIITTGCPSLLRQALQSITTIILNTYAGAYGDEAVSAMSIVSRITFFTFSVAIGIGQGFQPVSGFNYGAKKYDRLKKAFLFTFIFSELLLTILNIGLEIFSGDLISIFRNDATVILIGTRALRLQAAAMMFLPFAMVTEMLLQSTGQKVSAIILSSLRNGIFFIPVLIIMANVRGLSGIQEAQPISCVISIIPSLYYYFTFFGKLEKGKQ